MEKKKKENQSKKYQNKLYIAVLTLFHYILCYK